MQNKRPKPGDRVILSFKKKSLDGSYETIKITGKLVHPSQSHHKRHACFCPDKAGIDYTLDWHIADKGYYTCSWDVVALIEDMIPYSTKVESKYRY